MLNYKVIEKAPLAKGKKELLRHLDKERLTLKQAVIAKCYDCMGFYSDGKVDCKMPDCSLYPFMPYNPSKYIAPRIISEKTKEAMRKRGFGRSNA